MSIQTLRTEIEDIQDPRRGSERDDHHERLFEVFLKIDAELARCGAGAEAEDRSASLLDAQTVLMRTAASLPARSMRDLVFKLALWRWDAPELDRPIEEMTRADAVAYSTFRDLARILGDSSVLKEIDKAN